MRAFFWVFLSAMVTIVGAALDTARGAESTPPGYAIISLSPAQFDALHASLVPGQADERWTDIPWETDLLTARQRAAREKKPLLMWVMDGHPLGCT